MTKADLIEEVSRVVEMTRKDSEVIVEAIFDSIVRALRNGDKIEIRGYGSFRTRQRQPRVGRNPKTGTRVEVPSKRIPYFKPSKELKDLVNNAANSQGTGTGSTGGTPAGGPLAGTIGHTDADANVSIAGPNSGGTTAGSNPPAESSDNGNNDRNP